MAAFLIQIIPNIVTCMTAVEMHALSPALVFFFVFFIHLQGLKGLGFNIDPESILMLKVHKVDWRESIP